MAQRKPASRKKADTHASHSPWRVVGHFLLHALAGLPIFLIIALPAWALNLVVAYLKQQGASAYVVGVLTFVEYGVLTIDAALYLALLCKSAYKAAKDLDL